MNKPGNLVPNLGISSGPGAGRGKEGRRPLSFPAARSTSCPTRSSPPIYLLLRPPYSHPCENVSSLPIHTILLSLPESLDKNKCGLIMKSEGSKGKTFCRSSLLFIQKYFRRIWDPLGFAPMVERIQVDAPLFPQVETERFG